MMHRQGVIYISDRKIHITTVLQAVLASRLGQHTHITGTYRLVDSKEQHLGCLSMKHFTSIAATALLVFGIPTDAFAPLIGVAVRSLDSGTDVDLGNFLSDTPSRSLLILGTYAADFNAIEYAQRLRYYLPLLKEKCDIAKFVLLLNCQPEAARKLAETVDLDTNMVQLLVDPTGQAGRAYGVGRGWIPENKDVNPFLKLFGMLWGLGAW